MNESDLQALIKQVRKETLNEELMNLDKLTDGISTVSLVGKEWNKLISGLEGLLNETKDFNQMYSAALHGPQPNTGGAMVNLAMILKLLGAIKPVVLGMDDIQKKDMYS